MAHVLGHVVEITVVARVLYNFEKFPELRTKTTSCWDGRVIPAGRNVDTMLLNTFCLMVARI